MKLLHLNMDLIHLGMATANCTGVNAKQLRFKGEQTQLRSRQHSVAILFCPPFQKDQLLRKIFALLRVDAFMEVFRPQRKQPGPEVIKLFSCSTQLSIKFKILISIKISRNLAYFQLR